MYTAARPGVIQTSLLPISPISNLERIKARFIFIKQLTARSYEFTIQKVAGSMSIILRYTVGGLCFLSLVLQKTLFFVSMAQDRKQEAIITAAIKRFAHFGVAKTTMAEIAADLSISKASLYYYFPDKLNLYAAVLQTITEAGAKADDEELEKLTDPFKAVTFFLEKRTDFIIKYHNIIEYVRTFSPANVPPELQPVFTHLKKKELHRLTVVIENGVKAGIFKLSEPKKTAELFFDFLEGFRYSFLLNRPNFFPDKKQFQSILKKEIEFAAIFFNGLTVSKPHR